LDFSAVTLAFSLLHFSFPAILLLPPNSPPSKKGLKKSTSFYRGAYASLYHIRT